MGAGDVAACSNGPAQGFTAAKDFQGTDSHCHARAKKVLVLWQCKHNGGCPSHVLLARDAQTNLRERSPSIGCPCASLFSLALSPGHQTVERAEASFKVGLFASVRRPC
jgi:hypothetical protein